MNRVQLIGGRLKKTLGNYRYTKLHERSRVHFLTKLGGGGGPHFTQIHVAQLNYRVIL